MIESVEARLSTPKADPILVVDGLHKAFGGLTAVDVDHLEVTRGAITALIGPNGAGKTTLFNVLSGFQPPDRGRWAFDGVELAGRPPHWIARQGMVRTFQLTRVLAKLSVLENMMLAARGQAGERMRNALFRAAWSGQERAIRERAAQLLERFGLTRVRDDYAGELSGGQRKLLEMARALMVEPVLLMLDEPLAGVNPALSQTILDHMAQLRDDGLSILFIEHDMDVVMGNSEWVVCMAQGRVISEGQPRTLAEDPAVIDAYLGARREDRE
ncbi:MAG: ABC transporter ATP-binding protein [Actinobacteria bacterium]|nr:ABC transporter ATP-binding protein [Actinomycetota bacterium]